MLILLCICALAGAIGGVLQGMVGVGTGVIVIPLLTLLLPIYGVSSEMAIHVALATSMAAIVVTSIAAGFSHHLHENVRWDIFKKLILGSILGSGIGALIASYMPARVLTIIFALFMFYTAYRMLRKKKISEGEDVKPLTKKELSLGGFFIGVGASIVGIGGGLFMVPFLHARGMKMRYVVGTATVVGLPVATIGALTYIITGLIQIHRHPLLLGYLHWPAFLAIAVTGVICASLGAKLSKILNPWMLQKIFAICVLGVGVKMLA